MSKSKATFNFAGNFEVLKAAPLDTKVLVDNFADLTLTETWTTDDGGEYTYVGMVVACKDTPGKLFQLKDKDFTNADNWVSISGSSEKISDLEQQLKDDELTTATALNELNTRVTSNKSEIDTNTEAIKVLNSDENTKGSVANSIKEAIEAANTTYSVRALTETELKAKGSNWKEGYVLTQTLNNVTKDVEGAETIPVYNDSSLKSVELVDEKPSETEGEAATKGQFLKFTYILADATESVKYLDVSKFLVEEEFADGLQVSDAGVVSLKIKENETALAVDENGLSFEGTETDLVDVKEDITVAGGPLADLYYKAYGKTTISKDTNMQDLLVSLFTKEIYPTESYKEATVSNSIAVPTFDLANQVVEVNASVAIPACDSTTTTYTSTDRVLSGLTNGYSEDGTTKVDATSISKSVDNIALSGDYSVTRSIQGTDETKTGASVSFDATTLTAVKGSNVVKLSITGAKASGTVAEIPSVYKYSNLGKVSDSEKTDAHTEATISAASTPTASKTVTITGVYPIYATTDSISELKKQALTTSKTFELSLIADSDTEAQRFALQKDEEIASIQAYNTVAKQYDNYDISLFKTSTTTLKSGDTDTEYTLYTRNEGSKVGATTFKITLK